LTDDRMTKSEEYIEKAPFKVYNSGMLIHGCESASEADYFTDQYLLMHSDAVVVICDTVAAFKVKTIKDVKTHTIHIADTEDMKNYEP